MEHYERIAKIEKEFLVRKIIRGIFQNLDYTVEEAVKILKSMVGTGEKAISG